MAFLIFFLAGIVFYLFNYNYFSNVSFSDIIKIFLASLRFDIASVFMINLPYILLSIMPFTFIYNKTYISVNLVMFYYIPNILALFLNFIDTAYFRFSLKRSTADFLSYIKNESKELFNLIPEYFRDFGIEILVFFALSFLLVFLSSRIKLVKPDIKLKNWFFYIKRSTYFILVLAFSIIMIRGGFQLRPISNATASKYTTFENIPLVLNTPFTIIKTINQPVLITRYYFSDEKLNKIYSPLHVHSISKNESFRNSNVVIIILESFTAEYTESLNPHYQKIPGYQGYTPFLDSLMQHSIYFTAYANGKRSIEALPAILAGLPILMNTDFISSPYAGNKIDALANILKRHQYHTAFFHGGRNGTMGFDIYTRIAGFEEYYGRDEYDNNADYDGKWGIFDEEFLQFFARKINGFEQPFLAVVFTLSSHHPYTIPNKYEDKFSKGKLKIHKSIRYADFSLKKFFETAKEMPWYQNTIFLITSDHASKTHLPENQNIIASYEIPLVIYFPNDTLKRNCNTIAQQADIMPTILSMLNLKNEYLAFGNDLLNCKNLHFAISYLDGIYQFIKDDYAIYFDGEKLKSVYDRKTGKEIERNDPAFPEKQVNEDLKILKALIQNYNNRMVNNQLYPEN